MHFTLNSVQVPHHIFLFRCLSVKVKHQVQITFNWNIFFNNHKGYKSTLCLPNAFAKYLTYSSNIITVPHVAWAESTDIRGTQQASSTTGCLQKTRGGADTRPITCTRIESNIDWSLFYDAPLQRQIFMLDYCTDLE